MSEIRCKGCGMTWDWDVSWDDAPEGEEVFIHEHGTEPWATEKSYYCSVECLVGEVGQ